MATAGEVGIQTSDNAGSEDVKCQPCHEEGESKHVQYIPDAAKEIDNNAEFQQVRTCLATALYICKDISDRGNQTVESIQESCTKALASVESHRREINEALDKVHAGIVEKSEAMKTRLLQKVSNVLDKYQEAYEELQQIRSSSEQLRHANQNCDLYTEMMSMKDKLGSLLAEVKEVEREENLLGNKIQFSANLELLRMLRRPETFGTLIDTSQMSITGAKLGSRIDIKSASETENCLISGATFLPDNKLMVTDWGNGTVKVVDMTRQKIVAKTKMASAPWDICKIQNSQVAVSLPYEGQIAFMTVADSELKIDRTMEVDGHCRGLDYKNSKLAVSFGSQFEDKIQILNLQGVVLHEIPMTETEIDHTGEPLYKLSKSLNYLSFSRDGSTLYISDSHNWTVTSIAFDGTVLASYKDVGALAHPMGITMDSAGNLYVCGRDSNSMLQLSPDLQKIRILLKGIRTLKQPWAISYSEDEHRFYVGKESRNKIDVYRAIYEYM